MRQTNNSMTPNHDLTSKGDQSFDSVATFNTTNLEKADSLRRQTSNSDGLNFRGLRILYHSPVNIMSYYQRSRQLVLLADRSLLVVRLSEKA